MQRTDITGLVLAGGEGRRMGGQDKGLLDWHGRPLAEHALGRLAPQVGPLLLSINRNRAGYEAVAARTQARLCEDGFHETGGGQAGPLAGISAALQQCETAWLAAVPCDAPQVPADLVARLASALSADAPAAYARTPGRSHPTCCLLQAGLRGSARHALAQGQRKLWTWLQQQGAVAVDFAEAEAFANLNTPQDLQQAARG